MLLTKCKYLVTQNPMREILEDTDVLITGNRIAAIGKDLAQAYPHEQRIDCSERIVMPGLINAHTHLGMTALRGISDDKELAEWLADVFAAEKKMPPQDIEAGAYLGLAEAIRTGTTTIVDMYYHIDLAGKAAARLGIRYVGAAAYTDGHAKTTTTLALPKSDSPLVSYAYGPHAMYTVAQAHLSEIASAARKDRCPIIMHLAETRKERAEFKEKTGMLPVDHLEKIKFLGPDTILVHCVWLTKGELDIIAAHRASVVHCPQSNMKLAGGGTMPLREMQERGITVALGTDSAVSNNSLDMFREMHVCALLHKHHYWDPTAADAQTVLDMATIGGAKAIGRSDLGVIKPGNTADIITLDCQDLNLQPIAKGNVISHIVYAANGMNVAEAIVDGTLLLENKQFVKRAA